MLKSNQDTWGMKDWNGLPVLQETNGKQLSWKQMDLSFLHYSKAGIWPSCFSDKFLLLCHLFLGSLLNLAKHPASTVQLLGAEKALFRALKTKRDTPKFGLIYHASLVGQSNTKNKGKVSCIVLHWLGFSQGISILSFMMAWASQWGFSMACFTILFFDDLENTAVIQILEYFSLLLKKRE